MWLSAKLHCFAKLPNEVLIGRRALKDLPMQLKKMELASIAVFSRFKKKIKLFAVESHGSDYVGEVLLFSTV